MTRRTAFLSTLAALAAPRTATPATKHAILPNGNIVLSWNFTGGSQGWLPGFSDYHLGMPLEAIAEIRPIAGQDPATAQSGYFFQARNASDDLFMFLKRPLGPDLGLKPDQNYMAHMHVQMYSNAQSGCIGAGGAPGEAVRVKAGVTVEEPATTLVARYVTLNLDKGNQAAGGEDLHAIGDIANGDPCELPVTGYRQITRVLYQPNVVRTGGDATLWATVGTDSGFEGITTLYFWTVGVVLIPA